MSPAQDAGPIENPLASVIGAAVETAHPGLIAPILVGPAAKILRAADC